MKSDPATTGVKILRRISAPRDVVFKAWTDPAEIKRWWSPLGCETPSAEVDLRVGGSYRISMKLPDGEVLFVSGVYREVHAPSKLVFTWAWDEDGGPGPESLVTVEFVERDKATEVLFSHDRLVDAESRDKHAEGWTGCFDKLEAMFG